jgi:hypothetical protein
VAETLTPELASRFAHIALGHVEREYPHKLDHVMSSDADVRPPRELHPIFFGSFDWHSCVHGYWTLARLLRRFPEMPEAGAIAALFERRFTSAAVEAEVAFLRRPESRGFERPYGWAWLLMLQAELSRAANAGWAEAMAPLAAAFVDRFQAFLPLATYPVRVGTHFNTAFALALASEYAEASGDASLKGLLRAKALAWYGADADCQAWEPSGDDFLSSALMEAECMRRLTPAEDFPGWFARFLPRVRERQPAALFEPAVVSDRSDGKIAHLDGLNLSRAWCWRALARALPPDLGAVAREAADRHLAASLPQVAGDYMGEHWLASFAVLALDEEP